MFSLSLEDENGELDCFFENHDVESIIDEAAEKLTSYQAPIDELYGNIILEPGCLELECEVLGQDVQFFGEDSGDNIIVIPYENLAKAIKNHKKYKVDASCVGTYRLEQELANEKSSMKNKMKRMKEIEEEIAELKNKKSKKSK